jgi:hypothetical protein
LHKKNAIEDKTKNTNQFPNYKIRCSLFLYLMRNRANGALMVSWEETLGGTWKFILKVYVEEALNVFLDDLQAGLLKKLFRLNLKGKNLFKS